MTLLMEAPELEIGGDWVTQAACAVFYKETGYDAWYGPDEDEVARATAALTDETEIQQEITAMRRDARETAISICKRCPVRAECLRYAMEADVRTGVWGGLSSYSRVVLKHKLERNVA